MTRLFPAVLLLLAVTAGSGAAAGGESGPVLGLSFRGAHRAYPAGGLASPWIINDTIAEQEVLIYYDRERSLARAYVRMVLGDVILFADRPSGVIGDDLTTMTRWDLTRGKAVSGNLAGMELVPLTLTETSRSEWNRLHPDTTLFPEHD